VFEKMLFGSFKEATADRDFEICISKTSPDVFDLAMRYKFTIKSSTCILANYYVYARTHYVLLQVSVQQGSRFQNCRFGSASVPICTGMDVSAFDESCAKVFQDCSPRRCSENPGSLCS